jgi:hypothetical protein
MRVAQPCERTVELDAGRVLNPDAVHAATQVRA